MYIERGGYWVGVFIRRSVAETSATTVTRTMRQKTR